MMQINTIHNMDCLEGIKQMNKEGQKVDLVVTSPPYYNAMNYSQWESLEAYFEDMRNIFSETYKLLNNHRYFVLNISDVTGQVGKRKWSTKKIPLGAYFTIMMEHIGYQFVDSYIWDKGEVQGKRHVGNPPYPFYQYPLNVYEYVMVFVKHELDKTKIPCPICHQTITQSNSQTGIGVQSWECVNPDCSHKSESDRGKRFSQRSVMMDNYKVEENRIESELIQKWRRDIVKINPVIKINKKGENFVGHPCPFPEDIPEMAIKFFSGVSDLVLDMFAGSGTSLKKAKELKRNFVGFELDETFCKLANERIMQ
jgi:DNA modification methylase